MAEVLMFEFSTKRESRLRTFWPDVDDIYGAQEAITLGKWACLLIAGATTVFALLSWPNIAGLVDAAAFGLLGRGLYRRSRIAAVVALLLFIANQVYGLASGRMPGFLSVFIFVGLLNGVRGTFAYSRLLSANTADGATPEAGSDERDG